MLEKLKIKTLSLYSRSTACKEKKKKYDLLQNDCIGEHGGRL